MTDAERLAQPLFKRESLILNVVFPLYGLLSENPPPCNEYYLMQTCHKEVRRRIWNTKKSHSMAINQDRCRYSHEYDLTDEQLTTIDKNAKYFPCWFLNDSLQLSFY